MHAYSNTTRAMDEILRAFEKAFGPPGAYVIAMGDWSRGWKHARDGKRHFKGQTVTMAVIDSFRAHVIGFVDDRAIVVVKGRALN